MVDTQRDPRAAHLSFPSFRTRVDPQWLETVSCPSQPIWSDSPCVPAGTHCSMGKDHQHLLRLEAVWPSKSAPSSQPWLHHFPARERKRSPAWAGLDVSLPSGIMLGLQTVLLYRCPANTLPAALHPSPLPAQPQHNSCQPLRGPFLRDRTVLLLFVRLSFLQL